jgi:diguanylate cyclase (GGDEF)-like protein
MQFEADSILARLSKQLSHVEKRDWELWLIVCITGAFLGIALLAILIPAAFLKQDNFHFEITVSRPLALGLLVLLVLFNTYLVTRRLEVRRMRSQLISSTVQSELVRLQSFTDPLTEVYNRRSLEDMAGRFISHARRLKRPLSFILIDVDRFKQINTRFGHLTGDLVLAEIATLLKSSVRGSDAVVRYGGDEFVLILADTDTVGVACVVERIDSNVHGWNQQRQLENFDLSLSIGSAEWVEGKTLDEVLDVADQNMYESKNRISSGVGQVAPQSN